MTVSVVIPAFDAEGFLSRAVASALAEGPLEVIVVDDASRDGTRALAERLAAADPRVRVLALAENGGPSKARNAGFAAARGDWIAVLDADDAFLPGRLTRLAAAAFDADIVADNIERYDHVAGRAVGLGVPAASRRTIDAHAFVDASRGAHSDMDWGLLKPMFRRAFLAEHALAYPPGLRHGEDFVFLFRALLAGARFVFTPEPGYRYTERVGALSGAASGLSRTLVDYDAMARDTLTLMEDPGVAANPGLLAALRKRHAGLRALDARRQAAIALHERRLGVLARLVLTNPHGARAIATLVGIRARQRLGLSAFPS